MTRWWKIWVSGRAMDRRPSAARPRLMTPFSPRSAPAEAACHNNRLTHGGSACVRIIGGGVALDGTAHGQNATIA